MFGRLGPRVHPFAELNAGYLQNRPLNTFDIISNPPPGHVRSAGSKAGINIFVTPTAALETGLEVDWDLTREETRTGLLLGFQFFLSVGFHLWAPVS